MRKVLISIAAALLISGCSSMPCRHGRERVVFVTPVVQPAPDDARVLFVLLILEIGLRILESAVRR